MKVFIALAICVAVVSAGTSLENSAEKDSMFVNNENIINAVNNNPHSTWTAGSNTVFEGMTMTEVKATLGSATDFEIPEDVDIELHSNVADGDIPAEFDSRKQWPEYTHEIRNQEKCGSCWAFGATEAFSDKLAIFTKGAIKDVLSPQWLVSCAPFPNMGCNGGIPFHAWLFMWYKGVPTDACVPYESGDGSSVECPSKCKDGSDLKLHKLKKFYKVGGFFTGDAKAIQKEIMTNGPVEGGFKVYEDFMQYKNGVYQHQTGRQLGGHAIKITGWGTENGVDYWLVANSWGPTWGEEGYFKIARGKNEVGIERTVYSGIPADSA